MGLIAIMLAFFVMFSFMFTQMLHFQLVRGHGALDAALRFLPLPVGLMPAAANSIALLLSLEVLELSVQGLPSCSRNDSIHHRYD